MAALNRKAHLDALTQEVLDGDSSGETVLWASHATVHPTEGAVYAVWMAIQSTDPTQVVSQWVPMSLMAPDEAVRTLLVQNLAGLREARSQSLQEAVDNLPPMGRNGSGLHLP